jgi:hypothetical protein
MAVGVCTGRIEHLSYLMKRARNKKPTGRNLEIVEFMTEFARLLVAAGIPRTKFARIVEFAYFQAASQDARFRNNRVNQSAVAAMTGLTRSQVRAMLKQEENALDTKNDRVGRIIATWTSDAEYMTSAFAPRRLRIIGPTPSFSTLVRRAGGDVPYRSLLRELERRQLVSVNGRHVSLIVAAHREIESRSLRHVSSALARVIQTTGSSAKVDSPFRAVTMEVCHPVQSGTGRILMQRRLSKIMRAFMADVEAAGAAIAMESPSHLKGSREKVSQVRVMLVTNEKEV